MGTTCLLLEDLILNLVLELLELVQLGELVLLLEEHLRSECCRRGKVCGCRVHALKRYEVGHGHEIKGWLEGGIVRSSEILEGMWWYTMV